MTTIQNIDFHEGVLTRSPYVYNLVAQSNEKMTALTFDDVTLRDLPSDVHPNDVNVNTWLTPRICLKNGGILSAAMDTVTGVDMAVAMAKNGGLGIIHRNNTPEEQVAMVSAARRQIHYRGMVRDPVTVSPHDTLAHLQARVSKHGWSFTSFPVVDSLGECVGLITRHTCKMADPNNNPTMKDIMIASNDVRFRATHAKTTPEDAYRQMRQWGVNKLPVVNKEKKLQGLYVYNDVAHDQANRPQYSIDDEGHFLVGAAIGLGEADFARARLLVEQAGCKVLVLDSSHGACNEAVKQLYRLRRAFGQRVDLIVGNVASYEGAKYLLQQRDALPDVLKVGIGPGSICTTRRVTGHGVPQLTAIAEVWRAMRECYEEKVIPRPIAVIADGGIRYAGDIVKAYAFGASAVMIGGKLAGTAESLGEVVWRKGTRYKRVRGMASREALEEQQGSRQRYKLANANQTMLTSTQKQKVVPEGVTGLIPYTGTVAFMLQQWKGGLRSGFGHTGAKTMKMFKEKAAPWRQTAVGLAEGHPHDIKTS